ncbi:hypothetical protein KPL70_023902 [Citrus sinensis]|uniref:uncharacterized protein At2g29880-like n=1 Tax=Citrus sinensis TaxID=2711 RepID=UPI000D628E5B|nr:uncharacterized protein At2g29880-like [Citrus sinensis]KAH9659583.1 hypothetical protein KPL70_023902 [Citrus sinensis]
MTFGEVMHIMASDDFDFDDKAEWSSRNEEIFIRILHEHVKMGDLDSKTTFNKKIWSVIDDKLFAETNRRFTEPKLKSKFNRLRKKHREFSDLIKHPGFDWNPVTNIVIAPNSLWANYAKKVPGVKPYRKKGLEHFHMLGEIFSTTTATSHTHVTLSQLSPTSDDERELPKNLFKARALVHVPKDDDRVDLAAEPQKVKRVRRSLDQSSEHIPKLWDKMEHYMEICSELLKHKLEKIKAKSSASTRKTEMYSIQKCVDAAEALGDVDADTFDKLMKKIMHLEWRTAFLSMNDGRKRGWLASL